MKIGDIVRIRKLTPELRELTPFVNWGTCVHFEGRSGPITDGPTAEGNFEVCGWLWNPKHLEFVKPASVESVLTDAGWREVRSGVFTHPKDSSCYIKHGEVWLNGTCGFMISTAEQAEKWLAFLEAYYRD